MDVLLLFGTLLNGDRFVESGHVFRKISKIIFIQQIVQNPYKFYKIKETSSNMKPQLMLQAGVCPKVPESQLYVLNGYTHSV